MSSELARLASHMGSERERASRRDSIRNGLLRQIQHDGAVIVTRRLLQECFPLPDMMENFFLAVSGCRPIPPLMEQIEQWCKANDLELRQSPAGREEQVVLVSKSGRPNL